MSPLEQLLEDTAQPFGQQQGNEIAGNSNDNNTFVKTSRI